MGAVADARWGILALAILAIVATPLRPLAASSDLETVYQSVLRLDAAGQHDEALSEARHLEELARARYGPNHARYAYALAVEAWMRAAAGQRDTADHFYQRALKLFAKTEGGASEHIPQSLLRLG